MKIAIIIPYFGTLPQWFQMFLNSVKGISAFDFFLYTDDKRAFTYPENVNVFYTSFSEMQKLFYEKLGNSIYLRHPYKFCDYRPAYGIVFAELIKDYEYWGYCDVDTIFGDVDNYLKKFSLEKGEWDRLFRAGPLSIYRNVDHVNNLYKTPIRKYNSFFGYEAAIKTSYPFSFDEVGINILSYQEGLTYADFIPHININTNRQVFQYSVSDRRPEIFFREDGKTYQAYLNDDGSTEINEFLFIHIMWRPLIEMNDKSLSNFLISEKGFIPFQRERLDDFFRMYGQKYDSVNESDYLHTERLRRKSKAKEKILREIKSFPFRAGYNIGKRYLIKFILKYIKNIKY